MSEAADKCGARTVFWPDEEACDAVCYLPEDHEPAHIHQDEILGEWNEEDMP